MRILYIAPRFHTNQSAVVKGWMERGNEVSFISYYTAIIEDYSCIKPIVLGYSPFYYPIDYIYVNLIKRNDPANTAFKINHGFPPIFRMRREMRRIKPDIVIMRDRTLYTIVATWFCRRYHYDTILYNQSPLWDKMPKQDYLHRLIRKLCPAKRMTPVMGTPGEDRQIAPNSYYVPFVVEPQLSSEKKQYFLDGKIEILSIGKFEPRKHHMMLMEVIGNLKQQYPQIHLTIIGEATGRLQKEHLQEVLAYREAKQLTEYVDVYTNVPREKTNDFFRKTDVFVIPSTREMASISQLEAMSFSIPVIISDKNGAACYVEEAVNGYHFEDCNQENLQQKVELLIADKDKIQQMGRASYELVCRKYSFENYYQAVKEMLEKQEESD